MQKNKEPLESDEDSVSVSPPYERYHGMNDTRPSGSDALRLALAEQYQIVNALLSGDTPNLYVLKAKKKLNEIGAKIDQFDPEKDPDTREAIHQEITDLLGRASRYIEIAAKISTSEVTKTTMGVKPLADSKRATLIIPSDWENPDKPLH